MLANAQGPYCFFFRTLLLFFFLTEHDSNKEVTKHLKRFIQG
jgi:hypothetical protein